MAVTVWLVHVSTGFIRELWAECIIIYISSYNYKQSRLLMVIGLKSKICLGTFCDDHHHDHCQMPSTKTTLILACSVGKENNYGHNYSILSVKKFHTLKYIFMPWK